MYNDVAIPLPQQMTREKINRLPTPLRTLILRCRPSYGFDRERLQWMYRSYYGAISHIDREVGLILDELDRAGIADTTIVVFSSDHGDQLLEHGLMGTNCFFESSIRVPFIIPEVITGNKESFEFIKNKGIRGTRHPDAKMVRTRGWKYIYYPEGFAELYDLKEDPNAMTNLAEVREHRERVYEMKDRLLHWLTTADEPDQIAPRWLRPK